MAHPFDQVRIAILGFDEDAIMRRGAGLSPSTCSGLFHEGQFIPMATEIHHRNKRHNDRLLDERWWIATSPRSHQMIERQPRWAREEGYSLPIQADLDGKWGSGNQALTTPELMESKRKVYL